MNHSKEAEISGNRWRECTQSRGWPGISRVFSPPEVGLSGEAGRGCASQVELEFVNSIPFVVENVASTRALSGYGRSPQNAQKGS